MPLHQTEAFLFYGAVFCLHLFKLSTGLKSMNTDKQTVVTCPRCKTKLVYSQENPYRPFCSERCKLIDLGAWANEDYRIPLQSQPQSHEIKAVDGSDTSSDEDDTF
ncbi:MAG: ligase inhibitor [Pseudomonadota bacterium]|jgi:endogenous inhibitor of DNA gyrase (YacG/DUF329 family)